MIRTLIIDDEEHSRRVIRTLIERYAADDMTVVAEVGNTIEARKAILQHAPDVLFLDIHMPGEDGLHLLGSIHPAYRTFLTVFTTAFDQYLMGAMKERALDFLVKPVDVDEFAATIEKIRDEIQKNERRKLLSASEVLLHSNQITSLIETFERQAAESAQPRLYLPTGRGVYEVVDISVVSHCRAQRNYCIFAFATGRELLVTRPLKDYVLVLESHGFVRIHHSCMANLAHVQRYSTDSEHSNGRLLLHNGTTLVVARRKKEEVRQHLRTVGYKY